MTRDEAIKTLMKYQGDHDYERTARWIDAFESLGVLKLEEPEGADTMLGRALICRGVDPNKVFGALATYGLKVVRT